jgi:glycosyltransferase involved in cell wall biosynthesis
MDSLNQNKISFPLAIIIPFFNEEKRLTIEPFIQFAKENSNILLLLVNDGSNDETLQLLKQIQEKSPHNIDILDLKKNVGKGNAIRAGMEKIITQQIPFIAYIDADLSVSFDEILKLYTLIQAEKHDAIFGSRLKKNGSDIQRSRFRHIAGRTVATIIETHFKIGCYDTQCSAKIFNAKFLKPTIQDPFYTRWFFDIEIILRARKLDSDFKVTEIPLDKWEHKPGSKINMFSFFNVMKEILILFAKY